MGYGPWGFRARLLLKILQSTIYPKPVVSANVVSKGHARVLVSSVDCAPSGAAVLKRKDSDARDAGLLGCSGWPCAETHGP